jgi:hypothetical protein
MERVHKRVSCRIERVGLESDFVGLPVPGFIATCCRCLHQTEAIGTTRSSVRRCLSQMREECPCGGSNDYRPIGQFEEVLSSPQIQARRADDAHLPVLSRQVFPW